MESEQIITLKFDGSIFFARMNQVLTLMCRLSNTWFIARHFPSWLAYAK